jgi:DNA replication protein DnaC
MAKKSNKIRRICLYGGPGSGKSKLACYLNYMLMDYDIDLVSEYIKAWAYEGKIPESLDQ